ncbi:MAG: T9SS C-terminal target domain-containing protein [Flavobacteriia bacterium]|nr:T9SS C-terminal target domain-containing protein [Flavobacteriia bacterium]
MKKIYLSVLGITLFGGFAVAQKFTAPALSNSKFSHTDFGVKQEVENEVKGIVLWQNDFSNPANWTTSNDPAGTPAHTNGDWTITTNVNAIPVAALKPAGFTTAANGYALINSDAAGANAFQNAKIVYNQNIDLTSAPQVLLKFQQSHRRYQENTYVVYSTNGGATWQEMEVNATMSVNTNTTNPQTLQVNLSNQIGGHDSVRIGFKYTGNYDWFWAVDDVKLMTPDAHDVAVSSVYWGSTGAWGARLPYYQIPTAQVTQLDFSGIIANLGYMNQNATSIYARDKNTISGGSYNQGQGFEVGNIFDIYAAANLSAIDVFISGSAVAGASVYSKLYSIDAQGNFVYVDESNPYTLTSSDLNALITLPLSGGASPLTANQPYLVVVGSLGDAGATNDLVVGTSGVSEAQTSYYLDLTNTTWYYTTGTPMVRMNFSNASLDETSLAPSFDIAPNPASGVTTISLGNTSSDATLTILDVTGKEVLHQAISSWNGAKSHEINTANFGNGVYFVNVASNGIMRTKKLVVRN